MNLSRHKAAYGELNVHELAAAYLCADVTACEIYGEDTSCFLRDYTAALGK